ncbi:MAG: peptide-methionine (S)-S-oxide reductase MsrA [Candidatus Nanohaloarchaeota archaeon QJJ-5]|nr:peptide-methionine (S)-S-oxide reductase MsrA [Candidatus Nanohaloarchaeota archaeon QJJ-5]
MYRNIFITTLIGVAVLTAVVTTQATATDTANPADDEQWHTMVQNETPKTATFAGGCFWCIEGVYQGEKGIASAVSGFTGGSEENASYNLVVTGKTDHREAVKLRYYPSLISYKELLDMYWKSIDPTDAGGQFSDRGYHYTTAIYTHTDRQYRLAKESKQNLSESGTFDEPIVTEILNASTFYRAADRHQNYSIRNQYQYEAYERASGRKGFLERTWENSPLTDK